jgi:hypothetical protein
MEIRRPRESLRVWWKKCGTRNDSSAGSRPGRQARGDIGYRLASFLHETKLSTKAPSAAQLSIPSVTSVASVRCSSPMRFFPAQKPCCPPKRLPSLLRGACFVLRLRQWIPQSQSQHRRRRIWPSIPLLLSTGHRPSRLGAPVK